MIKSSIEKLSNDIGYDIGHSDDIVQSDLLNGFSRGLQKIQKSYDYDMQVCYIVDKLSEDSMKMIEVMARFVELKKEEK